jgi:acylphosphatase
MAMTQAIHRKTCYFSGHVQGVGFRYTVRNIAQQHDVRGYVRNLSDGRVELVMEGPDTEMDGLISEVIDRMSQYVKNVDQVVFPATGEFAQFCIRHC